MNTWRRLWCQMFHIKLCKVEECGDTEMIICPRCHVIHLLWRKGEWL